MDLIVVEFTHVHGSISPLECAASMLLTVLVVSLVLGRVRPSLNSVAVLLVLTPVTLVFCSVHVYVHSLSVSLVIVPLTFVNVSVRVNQSALPVSHIIFPVALVLASIFPDLDSATVPQAFLGPLSYIDCSVVKLVSSLRQQTFSCWAFWLVVYESPELLLSLLGVRVTWFHHKLLRPAARIV
jgi:hypothetical protein